ncbi:MAG TPA: hypothetical protein IGS17_11095 [Oscillatoriales cyanobacterium M59_W2019_021]|nr:hypothetical protein [Oscillatoriales cyanobacterium M4454_W2019_049]HIK51453.1 hypothetical protein [Oscillatoriales cyanobacterium M59_W2019_021]
MEKHLTIFWTHYLQLSVLLLLWAGLSLFPDRLPTNTRVSNPSLESVDLP